jgi:hypothetical protein
MDSEAHMTRSLSGRERTLARAVPRPVRPDDGTAWRDIGKLAMILPVVVHSVATDDDLGETSKGNARLYTALACVAWCIHFR